MISAADQSMLPPNGACTVHAPSQVLVLDTNVVLDWLVFADDSLSILDIAVSQAQVVLMTHAPALTELRRVLAYVALKLPLERQQQVLTQYQRCTREFAASESSGSSAPALPHNFPVCSDPDDQPFLALAWHIGAALVTRDRALLRLRKKAYKFGVRILQPQQLHELLRTSAT